MAEFLNWQQAIQILGCSKSHFYNLINSGELPAERYGKTRGTTVRREDCEAYKKKWLEREVSGENTR